MDVYDPSLGTPAVQIHDLNPGIKADGLFWTTPIPDEGIDVNLGKGSASMFATNVPVNDYGTIQNSLFGGGPAPIPSLVSFTVDWSGVSERVNVRNTNPAASGGGFAGELLTPHGGWIAAERRSHRTPLCRVRSQSAQCVVAGAVAATPPAWARTCTARPATSP